MSRDTRTGEVSPARLGDRDRTSRDGHGLVAVRAPGGTS